MSSLGRSSKVIVVGEAGLPDAEYKLNSQYVLLAQHSFRPHDRWTRSLRSTRARPSLLSSFRGIYVLPFTTQSIFFMPSLFIHDRTCTTPSKHYNLYRENNRLLPILRIYPDLLEYIFLLGASFEFDDPILHRQRAILSYSQTCHDWRIVAISIRSLWAGLVDFEVNSEAWNKELLRRSYPFPFVVGSTAYNFRHPHVISAELMHLERIRIYRVGFDISTWDILVDRLQQPAPRIEYLSINNTNQRATDSLIFPSDLFAGDAPRLKRLDITQCLIDFQAPVLRSLTALSVEFYNASNAPTPLEWLENLTHLPSLTSLRLLNSMRSQGHSMRGTKQVELSFLSTLNLDASLHDIRIFIDGLKFPDSCGLIIICYECHPGPDLDIVLTAYLHGLNYAYHLRPESCPFFINAHRSNLFVWNRLSILQGSHTADLETPTLFLNLNPGSETWETLLGPVLHILGEAFSNFTSLELQLPATHPGLLPCLFRATKLTRFNNVSPTMTKNLLSQIQIMQSSGRIPLPELHTIVFTDDESMWGAPYQVFVSFLTWRRIIGYPITRVLFRKCLVLNDRVLELESLGVQVDCDSEGSRWQRL